MDTLGQNILNPFNSPVLRDSLFELLGSLAEGVPKEAVLLGSGPFEQDEFERFLKSINVESRPLGRGEVILIVGHEGWDEEELESEVALLREREVALVYSQEMFLFYQITGSDPFELEPHQIRAFTDQHPAFVHLSKLGFGWPGTQAPPGDGGLQANWPRIGPLKYMGYMVGRDGPTKEARRSILSKAFKEELPKVNSAAYMDSWGAPGSATRLKKIACSIAAFCRSNRRRSHPSLRSIRAWRQDLKWLKRTYYDRRFSFPWPVVPRS